MKPSNTLRVWGLLLSLSLCLLVSAVLLAVAISPTHAQGDTRYVAPDGLDQGDCTDPDNPCRTVQYAIDQAALAGDMVKVAAGTYTGVVSHQVPPGYPRPPSSNVVTQVLYLDKSLVIQGGYTTTNWVTPDPVANPTTLDAQGQGRALFIAGEITPTIEGLRITGGNATGLGGDPFYDDSGGGIYVISATTTISNSVVLGNVVGPGGSGGGLGTYHSYAALHSNTVTGNSSGYDGGGVFLSYGAGTLQDNLITANTSITRGGGVWLSCSPSTLLRNTIQDNEAGYGGGLFLDTTDVLFQENTVASNSAIVGGGMYLGYAGWVSSTSLISNTFSLNSGIRGGGLWLVYAPISITGNLITGNVASDGGGLAMFSSAVDFQENTFASNTAYDEGGGMWLDQSNATFTDNVFQDNIAGTNGGGLLLWFSQAPFRGNQFIANSAGYGGGLWLYDSDIPLESNTFLENSADQDGGGLYLLESDVLATNNIVADNQAAGNGSGLCLVGASPQLVHNTIAISRPPAGSGIYLTQGQSTFRSAPSLTNTILAGFDVGIIVDTGCTATLEATLWDNDVDYAGAGTVITGPINIWGYPAFVDPGAGDYHIRPASDAIDAGVDAGISHDIEADPRPIGPGFDLGADESPLGLTASKEAHPDPVQAGAQLTYTLQVTNSGTLPFTATITDLLPAYVTPTGTLVWMPPPLLPGDAWMETLIVTVEATYSGPLPNLMQVATDGGATRSRTCIITVEKSGVEPDFRVYLPLVMRR